MRDRRTLKAGGKLNNHGSTLVMVIVILLFVGVIATGILTIVTGHLRSMGLIKTGTRNLYSAEEALDEIKARLGEMADKAYKDTYSDWLENYTVKEESVREQYFMSTFVDRLYRVLLTEFIVPVRDDDPDEVAQRLLYAVDPSGIRVELPLLASGSVSDVIQSTEPAEQGGEYLGFVSLKDVRVTYSDRDDYTTSITTDIDFCVRYPGFTVTAQRSVSLGAEDLPCSDYVLISDSEIVMDGAGGTVSPGSTVTGNVYAGEGIRLKNNSTTVTVRADRLISGGTIEVLNGADLTVTGLQTSNNTYATAEIWTDDIRLATENLTAASDPTMTVKADLYVRDDLSLDAESAVFTMQGGTYNGYMPGNAVSDSGSETGRADGSSAIIVNGSNATLDLRQADELWIAGKAYIMVPGTFGSTVAANSEQQYMEGESISYRGQQAAYLVPGECIIGVYHNPMTKAEHDRVVDTGDTSCSVDLSVNPSIGDLRITYYVKSGQPYRWAKVNYGGNSEDRYYLYLNFDGPDKAAAYATRYFSLMRDVVKSRMGTFTGSILLNKNSSYLSNKLHTTGISVTFENGQSQILDSTVTTSSATIVDRQYTYSGRYNGLLYALDGSSVGLSTSSTLSARLVSRELLRCITADVDLGPATGITGVDRMYLHVGTYNTQTGKRDVKFTSDAAGIVIVDGDVTIQSCKFHGLIIAGGKITMTGTNAGAEKSDVVISAVNTFGNLPYTDGNGQPITLAGLFEPMITGHTISIRDGSSAYSPELIDMRYSNWRKN